MLRLTKGVHLAVASERLQLTQAVVMRSDDAERRMMFAIPHGSYTYLGTTDTDYVGRPEPACVLATDVEYILAATNRMFPDVQLTETDVASTWVGLRPLVRPPHQTGLQRIQGLSALPQPIWCGERGRWKTYGCRSPRAIRPGGRHDH